MNDVNMIEMQVKTYCYSDDEDLLVMYESGSSYIYYVRNYEVQHEYIIVSHDLICLMAEEERPLTNVYLRPYFKALKQFEGVIRRHLLQAGLLKHFNHLFNCSVSQFFERL